MSVVFQSIEEWRWGDSTHQFLVQGFEEGLQIFYLAGPDDVRLVLPLASSPKCTPLCVRFLPVPYALTKKQRVAAAAIAESRNSRIDGLDRDGTGDGESSILPVAPLLAVAFRAPRFGCSCAHIKVLDLKR